YGRAAIKCHEIFTNRSFFRRPAGATFFQCFSGWWIARGGAVARRQQPHLRCLPGVDPAEVRQLARRERDASLAAVGRVTAFGCSSGGSLGIASRGEPRRLGTASPRGGCNSEKPGVSPACNWCPGAS